MAIAWKATWSNMTDANPCAVSTTADAGDYLIGAAQTDNNNASDLSSLTAGWSFLHARLGTTNDNASFRGFSKDAVAAGSDSVSITNASGNTCVGMVHSFSGVDTVTPLDVAVVTTTSDVAGTDSDTSITPTTNGAAIVYMHGVDDSTSAVTWTFSTTSGTTGAWDKRSNLNSGFFHLGCGVATQATAGALTARAASSVSASRSGVLVALRPAATADLEQEGFRWGVDDDTESAHTWEAAQDTSITIADTQSRLLRVLVDTVGDAGSTAYTLRYQKNGSGGYVAVPVGSTTETTPVIEAGDATESGNNTATTSWATVAYPNASTGDLLIFCISWDDSTTTTDVAEPSGPNGETLSEINATPATDSGTETRCKVWYTVATGTWTAGNLTFTPTASEQWTAAVIRVPAGEFDAGTPIGGSGTDGAAGDETDITNAAFTAGASDGGGRLCVWTSADADPQTVASGWSEVANEDRGAVSGGFFTRDTAVSDSEVITSGTVSTIASDTWASVTFVVRAPTVNNEVYVTTSGNITAGGEATTARLTAPAGKTTSDFTTGRRWDNENGSDSIDIAEDFYSEFEWLVFIAASANDDDFFDFRVYAGSSALNTYTVTPRWTIPSAGGGSILPLVARGLSGMGDMSIIR